MESSVYPEKLEGFGIASNIPDEADRVFQRVLRVMLLVSLTSFSSVFAQTPEDLAVTGQVQKVSLCGRDLDAVIYHFVTRLSVKNVGSQPIIFSTNRPLPDYYRIANSVDQLYGQRYVHIGWVTSGPRDPKSVPAKPVAPFRTLATGQGFSVDVDLRVVAIGGLKPGPAVIQLIVENVPGYSDAYLTKLDQAWSKHGRLWLTTFQSPPISFIMPDKLKERRCP